MFLILNNNIYQVSGGLEILERKEIQHTIYEPLN